jgi:hypothetical protein
MTVAQVLNTIGIISFLQPDWFPIAALIGQLLAPGRSYA